MEVQRSVISSNFVWNSNAVWFSSKEFQWNSNAASFPVNSSEIARDVISGFV